MPQRVRCLLTALLATVLLAGCGGQDTPVEQAEEEAGVEEVVEEPTERDIHSEGCPEGQISNDAGNECIDEDAVREAYENPMPNAVENAAREADAKGVTPEQKQNRIAQAASQELNLQQVDPRAVDVYECLVDEGALQLGEAEQQAIFEKLMQEKGVYDIKEMTSDMYEEAFGTDCGFKELGDIRRN